MFATFIQMHQKQVYKTSSLSGPEGNLKSTAKTTQNRVPKQKATAVYQACANYYVSHLIYTKQER